MRLNRIKKGQIVEVVVCLRALGKLEIARNDAPYRALEITDETIVGTTVTWYAFGDEALRISDNLPRGTVLNIREAKVDAKIGRNTRLSSGEHKVMSTDYVGDLDEVKGRTA